MYSISQDLRVILKFKLSDFEFSHEKPVLDLSINFITFTNIIFV